MKIVWSEKAKKSLKKFDRLTSKRIIDAVCKLTTNRKIATKIVNSPYYKIRVGDYRVIFAIDEDTVVILKIGHRKSIYRGF